MKKKEANNQPKITVVVECRVNEISIIPHILNIASLIVLILFLILNPIIGSYVIPVGLMYFACGLTFGISSVTLVPDIIKRFKKNRKEIKL